MQAPDLVGPPRCFMLGAHITEKARTGGFEVYRPRGDWRRQVSSSSQRLSVRHVREGLCTNASNNPRRSRTSRPKQANTHADRTKSPSDIRRLPVRLLQVDIWSLGCCLVEASPESLRFLIRLAARPQKQKPEILVRNGFQCA